MKKEEGRKGGREGAAGRWRERGRKGEWGGGGGDEKGGSG